MDDALGLIAFINAETAMTVLFAISFQRAALRRAFTFMERDFFNGVKLCPGGAYPTAVPA